MIEPKGVITIKGSFLKELRDSLGLSQDEVGKRVGCSQAAVSAWERNEKLPSMKKLRTLADLYGVSIEELSKGERIPVLKEIEYVPSDRTKKFIRVPVVGRIPAGIPIEAIEDIEDWEDFPIDDTVPGHRYFALKVKGDSMEPEYRDGDTVIVQQQEECQSGDDCAVMVNGDDATFKRVRVQNSGITLQPLNTRYGPVFYSKQEVDSLPVKILGVVVEVRRKIKSR